MAEYKYFPALSNRTPSQGPAGPPPVRRYKYFPFLTGKTPEQTRPPTQIVDIAPEFKDALRDEMPYFKPPDPSDPYAQSPTRVEDNRIGTIEQITRMDAVDWTSRVPFSPTGALASADLMAAARRLQKDVYEEEFRAEFEKAESPEGRMQRLPGKPKVIALPQERRQQDLRQIESFLLKQQEVAERGMTWGAKVFDGLSYMPAWMIEFALTGGLAKLGSETAQEIGLRTLKGYAKTKGGRAVLKAAGWTGGVISRATLGMPHRLADNIAEQRLRSLALDGGKVIEVDPESWATSILKGYGRHLIEVGSESAGEGLARGGRWLARHTVAKLPFARRLHHAMRAEWLKMRPGRDAEFTRRFFDAAQWHGLLAEYGEERLATILHAITGTEDFGLRPEAGPLERLRKGLSDDLKNLPVELPILAAPGAIATASRFRAPVDTPRSVRLDIGLGIEAAAPRDWGQDNTGVTRDEYERVKQQQRQSRLKGGRQAGGTILFDPQNLEDALKIARFHLEAAGREFAAWAREMVRDMGPEVRAYLPRLWQEVTGEPAPLLQGPRHAIEVVKSTRDKIVERGGAAAKILPEVDAYFAEYGSRLRAESHTLARQYNTSRDEVAGRLYDRTLSSLSGPGADKWVAHIRDWDIVKQLPPDERGRAVVEILAFGTPKMTTAAVNSVRNDLHKETEDLAAERALREPPGPKGGTRGWTSVEQIQRTTGWHWSDAMPESIRDAVSQSYGRVASKETGARLEWPLTFTPSHFTKAHQQIASDLTGHMFLELLANRKSTRVDFAGATIEIPATILPPEWIARLDEALEEAARLNVDPLAYAWQHVLRPLDEMVRSDPRWAERPDPRQQDSPLEIFWQAARETIHTTAVLEWQRRNQDAIEADPQRNINQGVRHKPGRKKPWQATVTMEGKTQQLGYYATKEAAIDARRGYFLDRFGADYHQYDIKGRPRIEMFPTFDQGRARIEATGLDPQMVVVNDPTVGRKRAVGRSRAAQDRIYDLIELHKRAAYARKHEADVFEPAEGTPTKDQVDAQHGRGYYDAHPNEKFGYAGTTYFDPGRGRLTHGIHTDVAGAPRAVAHEHYHPILFIIRETSPEAFGQIEQWHAENGGPQGIEIGEAFADAMADIEGGATAEAVGLPADVINLARDIHDGKVDVSDAVMERVIDEFRTRPQHDIEPPFDGREIEQQNAEQAAREAMEAMYEYFGEPMPADHAPTPEPVGWVKDLMHRIGWRDKEGYEPLSDKDFRDIFKFIQLPQDIAQTFPQFRSLYEIQKAREIGKQVLDRQFAEQIQPYYELSDAQQREVDQVLVMNERHPEGFGDALNALSPQQQKAYAAVRQGLDQAAEMLLAYMEQLGVRKEWIDQFRGRVGFYIPHKWYGNWRVVARDPKTKQTLDMSGVGYRERFTERDRLRAAYPDADVFILRASKMPFDAYQDVSFPGMVEMMDRVVENANAAMGKQKGLTDVQQEVIRQAWADLWKEKGFGAHFIHRAETPGYTENLARPLKEYFAGFTGYITKMQACQQFPEGLAQIDARRTPNLYSYASEYVRYNTGDALHIPYIKSLLFHWYLWGNLKSAAVNLTQNHVLGWPVLSKLTKWPLAKMLVHQARTAAGTLTADEKAFLVRLEEGGHLDPKFAIELGDFGGNAIYRMTLGPVGKAMRIVDVFRRVESYNRRAMAIALYHADPSLRTDLQRTADLIEEVHFRYSKGNRPTLWRGYISPFMTFRSYTLNYLTWLKNEIKAKRLGPMGRSMAALAFYGGVKATPFAAVALALWRDAMDTDPEAEIREVAGAAAEIVMRGAPSAAGVSLTGSLAIRGVLPEFEPGVDAEEALMEWAAGVISDIPRRKNRVAASLRAGDYARALEDAAPEFLRNPLAAWRLYSQGATTRSGRPIIDHEFHRQMKLTEYEAILKGMGFQPDRLAKQYQIKQYLDRIYARKQALKQQWSDRIILSLRTQDPEGVREIVEEISRYNQKMQRRERSDLQIDPQELEGMLGSRMTPVGVPSRQMLETYARIWRQYYGGRKENE